MNMNMNHCYYEANNGVDALVRGSSELDQNFVVFDSSPLNLCMLLFYDHLGLYYDKSCPQISVISV